MSRLTRTLCLFAIWAIVALTVVRPAHGQSFEGYAAAVTPMFWEDLSEWMTPAHLSHAQVRFVVRAYDGYFSAAAKNQREFLDAWKHHRRSYATPTGTIDETLQWYVTIDRIGRRANSRLAGLERAMFEKMTAALTDEQILALESVKRHRERRKYVGAVRWFGQSTGRLFVDLSDLDIPDWHIAPVRPILDQYEASLTGLFVRLGEGLMRQRLDQYKELVRRIGDGSLYDERVRAELAAMREETDAQRLLRLAAQIDALNDRTLRSLAGALNDAEALAVECAYWNAAVPHGHMLDGLVRRMLDSYSMATDPELKSLLGTTLATMRKELVPVFRSLSENHPRSYDVPSIGLHVAARNATAGVRNRLIEIEQGAKTQFSTLEQTAEAAVVERQLRWNTEEVQRERQARIERRTLPTRATQVQIQTPWLNKIVNWMGVNWNDAHQHALDEYRLNLDAIEESCESLEVRRCRDRILSADRELLRLLLNTGGEEVSDTLDILVALRERSLKLAVVRHLAAVAVDLVDLLVESGIQWHESGDLTALVNAYSENRSLALDRLIMSPAHYASHTPELGALALTNSEFLQAAKQFLPQDAFEQLYTSYWERTQPRIMTDDAAAEHRFLELLKRGDELPSDLRLELAARWLSYGDRYRALTDEMLGYVRASFTWNSYEFGRSIQGFAPDIGAVVYGDDPWIFAVEELVRLYDQRANLSALEHAYLDTIRIPDVGDSVISDR